MGRVSPEEVKRATRALLGWQRKHSAFLAEFNTAKPRRCIPQNALHLHIPPLPEDVFLFIYKVCYARARIHAKARGRVEDVDFVSERQLDAIGQCIRQVVRFDPALGRLTTFITNAAKSGVIRYYSRRKSERWNDTRAGREEYMERLGKGVWLGTYEGSNEAKFHLVSGDNPEADAEMKSLVKHALRLGAPAADYLNELPEKPAIRPRRAKKPAPRRKPKLSA